MDEKVTYWASVVLSALALVLLVVNVALVNGNRNLQAEISQRQTTINNGVNFSQINQGLVQALADAALKDDDKDIRDLLTAQGITFKASSKSTESKTK